MNENRYALLIASSKFQYENQDLQNLPSPENDVDSLYELLTSKDYGNFSREIPPLKNKSLTEIRLALEDVLIGKARKDDLVLIYYSGHGKPDGLGDLYLVATDTNPKYLRATGLPFEYIKDLLLDSKTNKVIIILDCCYSGLAGKRFARGGLDDKLKLVSSARGTYIMTSSTGTQLSWEDELEKYGIFSKHIIEGIRDGTAANGDGDVTMVSLYDHVYKQMQIEGKQTPTISSSGIVGDIVITSKVKPSRGKPNRAERAKKIHGILYELSSKDILPDRILQESIKIIYSKYEELSEDDRLYDSLLGRLLQEDFNFKELSYEWGKIEAKKQSISTPPLGKEYMPEKASDCFDKGDALYDLGKYDEAIKAYNKAIKLNPQDAVAWNNKGVALYNLGKYDEAIKAYNKAIEIDPDYDDAQKGKNDALKNLGKQDKAIKTDPNNKYTWDGKGDTFRKEGKYDEAIMAYDKAIKIDPNYKYAWKSRGDALYNLGRYDEAIKAYDKAINIDSDYDDAQKGKNDALKNLGKQDRAIKTDPNNKYNTWDGKGHALYNRGKYDNAPKIHPIFNYDALKNLGKQDKAIKTDPNNKYIWDGKGDTFRKEGKYDEAIMAYDKAIKIDPNYKYAWKSKGDALYNLGKYDEAIKAYDKAINIDPDYDDAWNNKGISLKSLGRTAEAKAAFAKAKELGYTGPS